MARRETARAKIPPIEQKFDNDRDDSVSAGDVASWIRERVQQGRMVPGQRLIEADLVRNTGATRSRVREALQRLASEGLLLIEEFRGASVRRFSREELHAIYRTRSVLEGLAAFDFAKAGSDALRLQLQEAQQGLDAAVAAGDHGAFARWNDRWHATIIEGGQNDYVAQFVDRLRIPVSRLLFASFHNRQRIDQANADHQAITKAILKGRSEEAELKMRQHVQAGFVALAAQGIED